MSLKRMLIAIYILAVSSFASAQVIRAQSPAPSDLPVQIKKVEYKELKAGKHQILVSWDADLTKCGKKCRITKLVIDVELTDAKGEKRRATRTLSEGGGSGKVSITPLPIPKELIMDIAATKIFGRHTDPVPDDQLQLLFELDMTFNIAQENLANIKQIVRKVGKVNAVVAGKIAN